MKTNTVNTDSPAEASELGLPTPPCSVSFAEFPKMARLSRECIITEKQQLTCLALSPYLLYGRNETKEKKNANPRAKESRRNSTTELGSQEQGKAQRGREGLSRSQVCDRGQVERRGSEGGSTQGLDDRTEIKAMRGLRRMLSGVLHGLRSPQRGQESPQHRQHVRPSLQSRTYSNRVGQMRLGLCELPQNTNP